MTDVLHGIHHLTAISGDPRRNLSFYRDVLGLRLVKRTVNFDDPFTYHLYYGDKTGTPGTILTFFPWPDAPAGRRGTGVIETVSYAVPSGSLAYWRKRLQDANVSVADRPRVFEEAGLRFSDPDGMEVDLVEGGAAKVNAWTASVPVEHAIGRFAGAAVRVRDHVATESFLLGNLDFTYDGADGAVRRYRTPTDGLSAYDLIVDPAALPARQGRGLVHHIAWMTSDQEASLRWRARLAEQGLNVSPLMDRKYFQSVYFREPGGVLFELATNGPGFAVDEPADSLGGSLQLPEVFESHRSSIEARLPPLEG